MSEEIKTSTIAHQNYYRRCGLECMDTVANLDFCTGNVVKYLWRYQYKGHPLEDLYKARTYLDYILNHGLDWNMPEDAAEKMHILEHDDDSRYESEGDVWHNLAIGQPSVASYYLNRLILDVETEGVE